MIHNEDKHSTKEFRCEEFRKLGLNDEQIEKVERIISENYLDLGVETSKKKLKERYEKVKEIFLYVKEVIELFNKLKAFDESYHNGVVDMIKEKVILRAMNKWIFSKENTDNSARWIPCTDGKIHQERKIGRKVKHKDFSPLEYLDVMRLCLGLISVPNEKTVFRKSPYGDNYKAYFTSPKRSTVKGVKYFYLHTALEGLTAIWESDIDMKASKTDSSKFMMFLSVILYGNSYDSDNARTLYRNYKEEALEKFEIPCYQKKK